MNTQRLQHGFQLLVWICCFYACFPVPQKEPIKNEYLVQPLAFEYLKIDATIYYRENAHYYNGAHINFRIKKDSFIWFSIRLPWGIEILRGIITPQDITLINHRQKAYYVYDYATLRTLKYGSWDYELLQSLLLGELAYFPTTYEVIQQDARQLVIQYPKEACNLTYFINPAIKKVEKLIAKTIQGSLAASYYPPKPCQESLLFRQATLHWYCRTIPRKPAITITLKGIKVKRASNIPWNSHFSIPAQYEKK